MLKQGSVIRENSAVADRVMDSNDLERERGITILAKNTSCYYNGVKINIIDTPGHADFSGEVERILKMADGVLLLVDSFEGTMPQTRFVLQKALDLGLKVIVVVNKVDRPDARNVEVVDEVLELFLDLDATEEQIESPVVFCSGRHGTSSLTADKQEENLNPLFEKVIEHIDSPSADSEGFLQLLVSSVDYNDYVGRIGIGKIERGTIKVNQEVVICSLAEDANHKNYKAKITALYQFEGLDRRPVNEASAGDIVAFSGIENINIGQTICAPSNPEPLTFVNITKPTVEMTFAVNDSPFAGKEGKLVTSRQIRDRLYRELLKDVSLRVRDSDSTDSWEVAGRGEMHLSILAETMRREGYEFSISTPRVLYKDLDGVRSEPYEKILLDIPTEAQGPIMEKMGTRKGELLDMKPIGSRMRMTFVVPSRGLFGYRSEFLTDTKGEGVLNTQFEGYHPFAGEIPKRVNGALVAYESGVAAGYGLFNSGERGQLFIDAGTPVYEGQVIGVSPKPGDLCVNVCKRKQLTNMRASGSDDALKLPPPRRMSLEDCLEFIGDDELVELTPKSLRIRKRILNNDLRGKSDGKRKKG
jgi:GTP-binding protein